MLITSQLVAGRSWLAARRLGDASLNAVSRACPLVQVTQIDVFPSPQNLSPLQINRLRSQLALDVLLRNGGRTANLFKRRERLPSWLVFLRVTSFALDFVSVANLKGGLAPSAPPRRPSLTCSHFSRPLQPVLLPQQIPLFHLVSRNSLHSPPSLSFHTQSTTIMHFAIPSVLLALAAATLVAANHHHTEFARTFAPREEVIARRSDPCEASSSKREQRMHKRSRSKKNLGRRSGPNRQNFAQGGE